MADYALILGASAYGIAPNQTDIQNATALWRQTIVRGDRLANQSQTFGDFGAIASADGSHRKWASYVFVSGGGSFTSYLTANDDTYSAGYLTFALQSVIDPDLYYIVYEHWNAADAIATQVFEIYEIADITAGSWSITTILQLGGNLSGADLITTAGCGAVCLDIVPGNSALPLLDTAIAHLAIGSGSLAGTQRYVKQTASSPSILSLFTFDDGTGATAVNGVSGGQDMATTGTSSWELLSAGGSAADLEATLASDASLTAELTTGIALEASLAGAASLSAELTTGIALAASLTSTSSVSANLTTSIDLAVSLTATATVTASLTATTLIEADLSSESSLTAELTTATQLAASLASAASLTATLSTQIQLAASLSATTSLVAALTVHVTNERRPMTGVEQIYPRMTGEVALSPALSGATAVRPRMSGDVTIGPRLTGKITLYPA